MAASDHADDACVGVREAGRRLGVDHAYPLRLARAKRLPRQEDGTFHVATCRSVLAAITDPAQARGERVGRWVKGGDRPGDSGGDEPAAAVTSHQPAVTSHQPVPAPPAAPPVASLDDARTAVQLVRQVLVEEGAVAEGAVLSLDDIRRAEAILKVRERHMRIAKADGQLMDAADVERTWSAEMIRLRGLMLAVPGRIAAQLGYSTLLTGALASFVANDPAQIILLLPTESDCRDYVVSDMEPVFEATPAVAGLLTPGADESGRSTLRHRLFPGGSIKILAGRSPRNLRRHTARVLMVDEEDGMEVTPEGDAVDLAIKRTLGFADRKIVRGSTPTDAETSTICREYEASDRRVYRFPPRTDPPQRPSADREISWFPDKERPHMPGSSTKPGRAGTRDGAPARVAFRLPNAVGTQEM